MSWADKYEPTSADEIFNDSYHYLDESNNMLYLINKENNKISWAMSNYLFYSLPVQSRKTIILIQDQPSKKSLSTAFPKGAVSKITRKYD